MIEWGAKSRRVYAELDPQLQGLLDDFAAEAPKELDISLICGWRSDADQDAALARGASTLPAGRSKHNVRPARAFDFRCAPEPHPLAGEYTRSLAIAYGKRVGFLHCLAARRGLRLRFGIDWRNPYDPYHVELA